MYTIRRILSLYTVEHSLYTMKCTLYAEYCHYTPWNIAFIQCNVHYTLNTSLYPVEHSLYTMHYTTNTITIEQCNIEQYTVYSDIMRCALYIVHCISQIVHCNTQIVHCIPYIVHCIPYIFQYTMDTTCLTLLHRSYIINNVTVYTVLITPYTIHCTVYSVRYTVYGVQCTVYTVRRTLYIVHCTLYGVQCTLYAVHCTLCTVRCTVSIVRRIMNVGYNVNCTNKVQKDKHQISVIQSFYLTMHLNNNTNYIYFVCV